MRLSSSFFSLNLLALAPDIQFTSIYLMSRKGLSMDGAESHRALPGGAELHSCLFVSSHSSLFVEMCKNKQTTTLEVQTPSFVAASVKNPESSELMRT